jgi:uncharacterized short protein YbdD (DUF466 family)
MRLRIFEHYPPRRQALQRSHWRQHLGNADRVAVDQQPLVVSQLEAREAWQAYVFARKVTHPGAIVQCYRAFQRWQFCEAWRQGCHDRFVCKEVKVHRCGTRTT